MQVPTSPTPVTQEATEVTEPKPKPSEAALFVAVWASGVAVGITLMQFVPWKIQIAVAAVLVVLSIGAYSLGKYLENRGR